jgi:predicted metalloprotease
MAPWIVRGDILKLLIVVAALLLTLFATGCYMSEDDDAESPTPAQTAAEAQGGGESRCPGGSLEGCFTYDQMSEYMDVVTPMVAQFFQERYPNVAAPRNVVFVPRGQQAATACGSVATSESYEYCGANQTIYVGQDLIWEFYRNAGDAAPAIGLAHEWGHHLQVMLGLPQPRTAAQSVQFENQADCISGAWAKYADSNGWLESEDDVQDIETLLGLIGSREGSGRDHGTVAERSRAFDTGFGQDLQACNSYTLSTR